MPELDKAKNSLIELGWSEYESRTYSALVQLGKATASKIAKNSNVPPNRVYQILSKLSERGVVHTTEARGSATEYEASDPNQVLDREKHEYNRKIENAKIALEELKERKEDTEVPITYTIYGKRELSTYLQTTLQQAKSSVFIAVDTLIEIRHREILDDLNKFAETLDIKVLTTQRGVNDDYEKEVAEQLHTDIGLKISDDEFATIFMVIDHKIMIYTAYGFKDKDRGELDYYGVYTEDNKTTRLLESAFDTTYEDSDFYREEDKLQAKEAEDAKAAEEGEAADETDDEAEETQEEVDEEKVTKPSKGPTLG